MDLLVQLTGARTAVVRDCTGDPSQEIVVEYNGYYRDQFTLEANNTGLYFPGQERLNDGSLANQSQPVPGLVSGGVIPDGNVTTQILTGDTTSHVEISAFKVAVSDEIAHAPLRQVSYQVSWWSFPVTRQGTTMSCKFRMAEVIGWGTLEE